MAIEVRGVYLSAPMAATAFKEPQISPSDSVKHAIRNFGQRVQFMAEENAPDTNLGELVARLTEEIHDQARSKLNPLNYISLGTIVGLIFTCGVLYQRLQSVEERQREANATLHDAQVQMQVEIRMMNQRMDQYFGHSAK